MSTQSYAHDLCTWLMLAGHGNYGVDLFAGSMPNDPSDVIAIRDTGGFPVSDAFDGPVFDHPTCQIAVRGTSQASAESRAWAIYVDLCELREVLTINGRSYQSIAPLQPPWLLTVDETGPPGRATIVFNTQAMRTWFR